MRMWIIFIICLSLMLLGCVMTLDDSLTGYKIVGGEPQPQLDNDFIYPTNDMIYIGSGSHIIETDNHLRCEQTLYVYENQDDLVFIIINKLQSNDAFWYTPSFPETAKDKKQEYIFDSSAEIIIRKHC